MKKVTFIVLILLGFISGSSFAQNGSLLIVDKHETIHLTKAEFLKRVADYEKNPKVWNYLGDEPCIVDFYTTWCGPCKHLAPILEELATEYKGKIHIYKVDTEKEPALAQAFGIKSIPTLLFCPKNANPQMAMGALPKDELVKIINHVLLGKPEPVVTTKTPQK
jgi:thioredoxin 1